MPDVALHTTSPAAIARAAALFPRQLTGAATDDRLTDDQIEAFTDAADVAASVEELEDVRHDMRLIWARAVESQGGLNHQCLPVIEHSLLVFKSLPEVIALCGEKSYLYVLLADVFRGVSADDLELHVRTAWIDRNDQALADAGWRL